MSNSSKKRQKVIVILGMHRSGTSAISRVMNLLGVDLGPNLLPAAPDNPLGFWEHKEIKEINEQLFCVLGHHWTRFLTPLPDNWWLQDDIRPFRQRLVALLKRDFADSPIWGLKDPRLCRLLPLWRQVFEEMDCETYFLHTIRNPLEVVASLKKRDGLSSSVSLILWLQHVLESETETRGHPRIFVTFDQLLDDWRSAVQRVANVFQCNWDEAIQSAGPTIDLFLNPGMRHHNVRFGVEEGDGSMSTLVIAVYRTVVRAAMGDHEEMASGLDRLSQELNSGINSSAGELLVPALESQISRVEIAENSLAELRSKLALCQNELDRVQRSLSWWLTSPMRRFYDYWTRKKN